MIAARIKNMRGLKLQVSKVFLGERFLRRQRATKLHVMPGILARVLVPDFWGS